MNTAAQTIIPRETKYCNTIRQIMARRGHATNAEILSEVQQTFPTVSSTTIHRATARLASRGELAVAPADAQGAMRYDANLEAHDHFMCERCGTLRDVTIAEKIIPAVEAELDGCSISGRITIMGTCKLCART